MAEYGRQTDEYGNPLPRPGGTGGVTGTHGAHDGGGIVGGIHQGRPVEKKGMVEKVKEKLPGGGNKGEHPATTTGVYDQGRPAEKKGMVEKVKEKLPGHQ